MEDKRFALLIDSDNISAKYIASIISEMTKYGTVTYKRIYGDWTNAQTAKWRNELLEHSITPIQQFSNTVGKNATDSALIIDAMDILYTQHVDGFCIVSSDSDFTRLASRLRESGMEVIGMGEEKTPRSFRAACTVFTNLEILIDQDATPVQEKQRAPQPEKTSKKIIEEDIVTIISENENNEKDTGLGEIGSRLVKKYSDFDVRNYGYSSLSTFLEEMGRFELIKKNYSITVRIKDALVDKTALENEILTRVRAAGKAGLALGGLSNQLHNDYENFKVKDYGYATFAKFVQSIPGLEVTKDNLARIAVKKKS